MSSSNIIAAGGGASGIDNINVPKIKTKDSIYEELVDVDYELFERTLEDLVGVELEKEWDDEEDRTMYKARRGLVWSDITKYDCPIKKQIILTLIANPRAFFILYNTQKGKSHIVAMEIKSWAFVPDKKVVAFLIVDNDKTLADQTNDGLTDDIDSVAERFLLSSGAKEKYGVKEIQRAIDAYAADKDGEYKMPVIVALNNNDQIKKVLKIIEHVKNKVETRGSPLRCGVVFDEADKVYPILRPKEFAIDGSVLSFKKLLVDNDIAVHRLGWVSATDGDLLDSDEYEECANAYCYPVPQGDPNYRALHHDTESVVMVAPHSRQDNNDAYAEKVLEANVDYFSEKVTLKDGTRGYRKVIVNSAAKMASMSAFALRRVAEGSYAITINMLGVTIYRPQAAAVRRSSKGVKFGRLLCDIYHEFGLHDRVLFIIGRRKVDRGLGFHYAPRDGSKGLVWTDMILGRVDDKNIAVQKAGRLAGIVAHCPQYPGKLTWWTDERTAHSVRRHNSIVDAANSQSGQTVLQAVKRAEVDAAKKAKAKQDNAKKDPGVCDSCGDNTKLNHWCAPIRFTLPDDLMDNDIFKSQLNDARRAALTHAIIALLTDEQRTLLDGRTVWHKRKQIEPIRRIEAAHRAVKGTAPGGGTVAEVSLPKYFWLDYLAEEHGDMPRGTAFITYNCPPRKKLMNNL